MAAGQATMLAPMDASACEHLSSSLDCHVPDNNPLAQAGALVVGAIAPPLIRLVPVSLDLESSSFERHVLAAVTVPRPPLNLQNAVLLI